MSKISVALCTYNGERFLAAQLNSILNQSIALDEIVICDDNSNDNTVAILESYRKQYPHIIRYTINAAPKGTIKNFEQAIIACTGDIIFLSDQDDVWMEDKAATLKKHFEANPASLLVFTDAALIDDCGAFLPGTLWEKWGFTEKIQVLWNKNSYAFENLLININKVTGATAAFRKELKPFILPIELPKGYWHDTYLALHAAGNKGLFFIKDKLIAYRIHDHQQVGIKTAGESSNSKLKYNHYISQKEFYSKIRSAYPFLFIGSWVYRKILNITKKTRSLMAPNKFN